jgi:diaminopimelate epimerase
VHVRGGDLDVAWDDDDRVRMRGNAVEVFEGTVEV